ncbi:hypothetical protein GJU39_15935 [Pedobacter petrophilus]|uniref:Fibronectin type III domain-containing protein n=1 Tax=Pedobacter petrophilus TaxID=1908241 RepID=A0A7K0G163_9SPHI|nr:hypothetical protein [Pedobacter petrophilus]MRX77578.1 hypothetical protein [Pedobacter petrophilus]
MKIQNIIYVTILAIGLVSGCEKGMVVPIGKSSMITVAKPIASSVTQVSALINTNIDGGQSSDVIEKGICWGTSVNPTTSSLNRGTGAGTGSISETITGLIPGTNYYLRAYFQTRYEILYSENIQFKTINYQLATVVTNSVGNVTLNGALGSGNVVSAGGGFVSTRGLCWSTSTSPTILNNKIASGSGTGVFTGDIYTLNPGTTYYVRAYATNQAGTAYGEQISFNTVAVKLATVSMVSINSISRNAASISATVTADGGGTIISKGLCYSSSTSLPTIFSNSYTNNGSGIGAAGGTLNSLSSGTTYYVRAYAVNSAGTAYGAVMSFKTSL